MTDDIPAQLAAIRARIAAGHEAIDARLAALEGTATGVAELRADVAALRRSIELVIAAQEATALKQLQLEQGLDRAVADAKLAPTRAMIVRLLKEIQADA